LTLQACKPILAVISHEEEVNKGVRISMN
jgi:hypothetical protein